MFGAAVLGVLGLGDVWCGLVECGVVACEASVCGAVGSGLVVCGVQWCGHPSTCCMCEKTKKNKKLTFRPLMVIFRLTLLGPILINILNINRRWR